MTPDPRADRDPLAEADLMWLCVRCGNGIPAEWVRPRPLPTSAGMTVTRAEAFCWSCYAHVPVRWPVRRTGGAA